MEPKASDLDNFIDEKDNVGNTWNQSHLISEQPGTRFILCVYDDNNNNHRTTLETKRADIGTPKYVVLQHSLRLIANIDLGNQLSNDDPV